MPRPATEYGGIRVISCQGSREQFLKNSRDIPEILLLAFWLWHSVLRAAPMSPPLRYVPGSVQGNVRKNETTRGNMR
jgi:hypothetical protein